MFSLNVSRDLSILAEAVYKPHNLSAMLRSCDAVGIGKIYAINPTGRTYLQRDQCQR
ncbi:MAG: hypothetical protein R2865_09305 [Deinococcales bacterium]